MIKMELKKQIQLLIFICFALSACEFHRENDPVDHSQAQQVVDSFYINLQNKKTDYLSNLFSGETSPSEAKRKFFSLDSAVGTLMDYTITNVHTDVVIKDSQEKGVYEINTSCNYERGKTEEVLRIVVKDTTYYIDQYNGRVLW